ncbi:MAG: pyridoxamine 5'-phosphate oxidase family protein [Planctomycetota bacterium]
MGQIHPELSAELQAFIRAQKIYFVGTAGREGRVNVSPKGLDTLRVIDAHRVAWLNLTGSGNETSAHVQETGRMTLMFCSFEGKPLILRVYGEARVVHPRDAAWGELSALFPPLPGARQVFDLTVTGAQTSCGFGVPEFTFAGDREMLEAWTLKKGPDGIHDYWEQKNQVSIDGKPTQILP